MQQQQITSATFFDDMAPNGYLDRMKDKPTDKLFFFNHMQGNKPKEYYMGMAECCRVLASFYQQGMMTLETIMDYGASASIIAANKSNIITFK